jgi:hypothetical protein
MFRVGGPEQELSPPHAKQIVHSQQSQDALVIDRPTLAQEFGMHPAIPVSRPPQRNALHLAA